MPYEDQERNIPSAADITSVKAEKVLAEAIDTIQNKNLDTAMDFLRKSWWTANTRRWSLQQLL